MYDDEVLREKSKIARFLDIKERSTKQIADRELTFKRRLDEMEKRQAKIEREKRQERKAKATKLAEQKEEWMEKRKKVRMQYKELENKAVDDYRSVVKLSKERMKKELDGSTVMDTKRRAREEFKEKSMQRERLMTATQVEEKTAHEEMLQSLELCEKKLQDGSTKAQMHKVELSQRLGRDIERVFQQGSRHRELQQRKEEEQYMRVVQAVHEKKAKVAKFEREKRKLSLATEEKNQEKLEMTKNAL